MSGTRLAVLVPAALAVLAALAALAAEGITYRQARQESVERSADELRVLQTAMQGMLEHLVRGGELAQARQLLVDLNVREGVLLAAVTDEQDRVMVPGSRAVDGASLAAALAAVGVSGGFATPLLAAARAQMAGQVASVPGQPLLAGFFPVLLGEAEGPGPERVGVFGVVQSLEPQRQALFGVLLQYSALLLLVLLPFAAVVAVAAHWVLTRRIAQLIAGTRRLAAGQLGERVEVAGHDEIGQLAAVFNSLAGQLEQNQEAQAQAQRELSASEERLGRAVEVAELGFFEHDHRSQTVYFSPRAVEIRGSASTLTPDEAMAAIHPEDRAAVLAAIARAHGPQGDGRFAIEHRQVWPDGTTRWISTRSRTSFEGEGAERRPLRTSGAITDITERKLAELNLRHSEELLGRAVEVAELGLFEHDHPSQTVYYSPRGAEIMAAGQMQAMEDFAAAIHPEDRAAVLAGIARAHDPQGDGRYAIEYRVVLPDGTTRWISTRSHTSFEGEGAERRPLRTVGAILDITERKLAELDRQESQADRFRMLVELCTDGYWEQDHEFRFTVLTHTPKASPRLGAEELYGKHLWELTSWEPISDSWAAHRALLERHEPFLDFVLRWLDGGGPAWAAISGRPIFDLNGTFKGYRGVMRDITAAKERELHEIDLARKQRDALVREVHHRIKNNLQGIAGLLQSRLERPDADALRDAVNQVQVIAKVHGLRGRGGEVVRLVPLLAEIIDTLRAVSSVPLSVEVLPADADWALPNEECVPIALVLNELMWNAVKHRAGGSRGVDVRVTALASGAVVVSVTNEGVLPAAFDSRGGDTSVGLGLVRALLPPQNAALRFECDGYRVCAELRVEPPAVQPVASPAASPPHPHYVP